MMEFLSPLAFAGALALGVPLVIHLLSSREAVVVKVGSIKFLEKSDAVTSRRPKLTELLLLCLRLALLLVLTLLIAEPILNRLEKSSGVVGWALISADVKNRVVDKWFYQTLDSLKAAGYEVRLLANGFPETNLDDTTHIETTNVWSLLKEADAQLPKNASLWLFTSGRLVQLSGERPTLRHHVVWKTAPIDEEKKWIQSARIVGQDSVLVTSGESNRRYVRWMTSFQSEAEARAQGFPLLAQEPPKRTLIFYDNNRKTDARYVEQGLRAVASVLRKKLDIVSQSSKELPQSASLIFWLSDKDVPKSLVKSGQDGASIIFDAKGDGEATNGFFKTQTGDVVAFSKCVLLKSRGTPVWRDEFGRSMLEGETRDSATQYFFYSRFAPSWSEFVSTPAFPEWLSSIIQPAITVDLQNDLRHASDFQRLPKRDSLGANNSDETVSPQPNNSEAMSLQLPLWIFATILFIIERIMSQRQFL